MYRNEHEVGQALRDSGLDRGEVFVTTKLQPGNAGRARATLAESLRALGTDRVDLWLIHWPPRRQVLVPLWREFLALRDEGLCRSVGVSNYGIAEIDELIAATGQPPAVNQIPWSPSQHDPALLAAHADRGIAVEGYSPQRHPPARSRPSRDRRPPPGHPRPGRPALAPRTRHHRHPQVRQTRPHQVQLRPLQLLPNPRRSNPPRPPLARDAALSRKALRMAISCPQACTPPLSYPQARDEARRGRRMAATVEGPAASGCRASQGGS